jgi:ketosteroid isomerase-like protein
MGERQLRRRRLFAQVAAVCIGAAAFAGCSTASRDAGAALPVAPEDRAAIERLLREQDEAWNRGDLHAFVAGYAASDRMTYMGKGGAVVRGRAALEARYLKSYPEGRRGTLTFSDLDLRRLGPDDYLVLGKWSLALPPDDPHGVFTLVFERGADGFAIIHDHSSGAD